MAGLGWAIGVVAGAGGALAGRRGAESVVCLPTAGCSFPSRTDPTVGRSCHPPAQPRSSLVRFASFTLTPGPGHLPNPSAPADEPMDPEWTHCHEEDRVEWIGINIKITGS